MDTELLKTFLEVHQTRHFGRAAENLFLTQAAVSARIKQLETSLGGPLFSRYRNNLQLTESGRRLVPHAQSMLIAWDRARQEVVLSDQNNIALGIGATDGLWDIFGLDILNLYFVERPDIVLRTQSQSPELMVRRLMDHTLDLAFLYEPPKHADLDSQLLQEIDLVLVKNINNSSTFDQLNNYVYVDWGTSFNIHFAKHFGNAPAILHTSLPRIALGFLLQQNACAYLPKQMIEYYQPTQLQAIGEAPTLSRSIYACYHNEHKHGTDINQLVTLAKTQLK